MTSGHHPFIQKLLSVESMKEISKQEVAEFLQEMVDRLEHLEDKASQLDHRTIGMQVLGPGNRSVHAPDPRQIEKIIKNLKVEKKHE